jgi:hypothetical protein
MQQLQKFAKGHMRLASHILHDSEQRDDKFVLPKLDLEKEQIKANNVRLSTKDGQSKPTSPLLNDFISH